MHRKSIGGALSTAAIATLTRPPQQTAAALAADVGRLHGAGLSAREIAARLKLSTDTVIRVLSRIAVRGEHS